MIFLHLECAIKKSDKKQKSIRKQQRKRKKAEKPDDPAYDCPVCPVNLTSEIVRGHHKADSLVQQHINLKHPNDDLSLKDEFVYLRHHVLFFMTDILLSVNRRAKLALELFRV